MKGYVLGRDAAGDLEELWNFIAADSIDAADRTIERLFDAFAALAKKPGMGHKRVDLTDLPVLFWPMGNYLVIYRATGRPIQIVAIVHGRRDIPTFLFTRRNI
jgi:plasmid stabilization system protein ParE